MNYDHSNEEVLGTSVDGVGSSSDSRMADNETEMTLTNRQGHPITDNQHVRTVGDRGPARIMNRTITISSFVKKSDEQMIFSKQAKPTALLKHGSKKNSFRTS